MSDDTSQSFVTTQIELNNNNLKEQLAFLNGLRRNSMSSGSSTHSDISEDDLFKTGKHERPSTDDQPNRSPDIKISRSMSDGQAENLVPREFAEIFPSLPDSVLDKLGLLGENVQRETMTEEEIEQKFISLALAFTIDGATVKNRCERQKRNRDQTENNLTAEINKLIEKVICIQPLCVDMHTAELLTGLLAQIDIVIQASYHAAISAERFGAVQHEQKLSDAVNLMISHVTLLKQQREAVKKQLQYTKKVLQDTNPCEKPNNKIEALPNSRLVTKRRASIATIVQPNEANNKAHGLLTNGDMRRIARRSSDLSTRISAIARTTRPNRLDKGADLGKINEGMVDNEYQNNQSDSDSDLEISKRISTITNPEEYTSVTHYSLTTGYAKFFTNMEKMYEAATNDGSLHLFLVFGALVCFVLGIIILGNILVELEFSKRGVQTKLFSDHIFSTLNSVEYFRKE